MYMNTRYRPGIGKTIRYDTTCYFNVRSKADMSQLNLPHGRDGRHIASILQVRLRLPVGHLGHTPIACLDYPQPESRFLSFFTTRGV